MTQPQKADVIVIGAGLSGLHAARLLHRAGLDVHVLEARDRVGGRTCSVEVGGVMFDLGGQWFGPEQHRVSALVAEMGAASIKTWHEGRKVLELRGRRTTYTGTIPRISPFKLIWMQLLIWRIERLCKQVPCEAPWKARRAEVWDAMTARDWLVRRGAGPDVLALFNSAIRVIFGCDLGDLSFLHFLHYSNSSGGLMNLIETHEGNQDTRLDGGAQQLSEYLAKDLAVTFETPVRGVAYDEHGVTVQTESGPWYGQRVIITLPPPLADRLVYSPPLPSRRDQLTQHMRMGLTVKCLALYDRPFWREAGFSGEGVNTVGPVSVSFDNCNASGQAALVAFVTGDPARGWSERPQEERRALVLGTLVRFFGEEAGEPTHYREMDWATEQWSGGAPIANFPPGSLSVVGPALRAPIGRIHWAGTETARESTGFMEGALESGERVAHEVRQSIGR